MLVLGFGLTQSQIMMSLVVRELILLAKIEHSPAPDERHSKRKSAGSVVKLGSSSTNEQIIHKDSLTNDEPMERVV